MSKTGKIKNNIAVPSDALICSLAMMVFSFLVPFTFPAKLVALGALIVPAFIISKTFDSGSELWKITGKATSSVTLFLYSVLSVAFGLILGALYHLKIDESFFPDKLRWFAFVAASIGIFEELIFRGFIQQSVRNKGAVLSIAFGTLAHTGYKCMLFLSPANTHHINISFLIFWTILAGTVSGIIRHISGSIIPSMAGHAAFDIIVYGGFISSPWWVW
jgi:membrane protease YdiL (CAAX protease family)